MFLWKIFCFMLLVCIASYTLQGIAAAAPTSPEAYDSGNHEESKNRSLARWTFPGILYSKVGKNDHKDHEDSKESEEIQLAQVYEIAPQQSSEQPKNTDSSSLFRFTRIQMILLGIFLLAIGGITISLLLPYMTGTPSKPARSKATSFKKGTPAKVYKTDLGELVDLASAYPTTAESSVPPRSEDPQSSEEVLDEIIPEEEFVEEGDKSEPEITDRLSSLSEASPTLMKMIKTFFRQSHFEFTEQSKNSGLVRSNDPRYRQYREIPVFIVNSTILDDTLVRELSRVMNLEGQKTHRKIAFIIVDKLPHYSAYQQIYTDKTEKYVILVPVSRQLIARALRHSTCAQALEKILSSTLADQNEYETNNPVENSLEFFGRDGLIQNLLDTIGHLQHIGLFGLRSIGKTSLVWQLREQVSQHIVTYIDLQQVPRDCNYLYYMILEGCRREAAFKYPDVKLPQFNLSPEDPTENQGVRFIQELVKMWERLKSCRHDIKMILLLDEADHFVPNLAEEEDGFSGFHEFMGIIRGISQEYGFLVSVIVSSHPGVSRLDTWKGQSNPGFQYYKEVFLSTLSEDGCNQMITNLGAQMGLKYTEEALSRIYYETGGHPYVTRQLCHLIAENSKTVERVDARQADIDRTTTIQVQDIEDAISEYIEYKSDYIESVWQRLSLTEQEILLTIITNHSCVLECLISSAQDYEAKRQRRKAISTLIENEIIEKCENKYSIRMGLFERFLLSTN